MVAKKDYNAPKHLELDVKNLHVIKALQSLTSRGYVSVVFSWQYYYYTLTPEGIDYLREFLHLPAEVSTVVASGERTEIDLRFRRLSPLPSRRPSEPLDLELPLPELTAPTEPLDKTVPESTDDETEETRRKEPERTSSPDSRSSFFPLRTCES